jgi:hypothetical protein
MSFARPSFAYTTAPQPPQVRFVPVSVYIDSGDAALAAYQFELTVTKGDAKIVGIEGGRHSAFSSPPYYDPAALMNSRVIIAALSTAKDLPAGKTRVTTIHMQITGDTEPEYALKLVVAANKDAKQIPAKISIIKGDKK